MFSSVGFIGPGALGILYGHKISVLAPVVFYADAERTARCKEVQATFNGEPCRFAYETPQTAGKPLELLFIAVKATGLEAAIETAKPLVGENTVVVSLLNGITSEDIIEEKIGRGIVLRSVALGMDALREGRSVTSKSSGMLFLGVDRAHKADARYEEAAKAVQKLVEEAGCSAVIEDDIERRIWSKWMFNIGVNQIVMIAEGTFATVQVQGPWRDMFVKAMREVVRVAQSCGVDLNEEDVQSYVKVLDGLNPQGMPSMRQDGLAHRPTEVGIFAAALIEKAEKCGVDVPVNRAVLQKVREMESRF